MGWTRKRRGWRYANSRKLRRRDYTDGHLRVFDFGSFDVLEAETVGSSTASPDYLPVAAPLRALEAGRAVQVCLSYSYLRPTK